MIIDAHTHIGSMGDGKIHTPEQLIKSMDEAKIDYSVLITDDVYEGDWTCEQIIEVCKKYPSLKAVGSLKFSTLSDWQVEKLLSYLKEGKIHAIKFYPGYENFYPSNEKLFPIYEACQKLGKAIIFHTGILASGCNGILKQDHPLEIDEVATKFPELKIVMAHFGNPWIIDAAAVVSKNPNVYVDLSGYFSEWKDSIAKEEVDDFVENLRKFRVFVGDFKKCLFGSDWPLYNQKAYLDAVKKLPMTEEEKKLVFWKNAREIYQLNV